MAKSNNRFVRILKRIFFTLLILFVVAVVFVISYPKPVLEVAGNWLVATDEVEPVEVLFVLSGAAQPRGYEAARLLKGPLKESRSVCTGSLITSNLQLLNLNINEGQLTQIAILQQGVDPTRVEVLPEGTSTWEEAEIIWKYAREKGLQRIGVLTSAYHARRTRWCLEKLQRSGDASLKIYGTPVSDSTGKPWWQTEDGLLFVNNEYVKYSYYVLKH